MTEQPKKKPATKADPHPWKPVPAELADTRAIQALARGEADEFQQKRALAWIVNMAAGAYDLSYRPGPDGERETCFAEGRRFVGLAIVKEMKINVSRSEETE